LSTSQPADLGALGRPAGLLTSMDITKEGLVELSLT
jgi:hypothetical protein